MFRTFATHVTLTCLTCGRTGAPLRSRHGDHPRAPRARSSDDVTGVGPAARAPGRRRTRRRRPRPPEQRRPHRRAGGAGRRRGRRDRRRRQRWRDPRARARRASGCSAARSCTSRRSARWSRACSTTSWPATPPAASPGSAPRSTDRRGTASMAPADPAAVGRDLAMFRAVRAVRAAPRAGPGRRDRRRPVPAGAARGGLGAARTVRRRGARAARDRALRPARQPRGAGRRDPVAASSRPGARRDARRRPTSSASTSTSLSRLVAPDTSRTCRGRTPQGPRERVQRGLGRGAVDRPGAHRDHQPVRVRAADRGARRAGPHPDGHPHVRSAGR